MKFFVFLALFLYFSTLGHSLIQDLTIKEDSRKKFFIENFGFEAGGSINLKISDFKLTPQPDKDDFQVGFLIEKTQTDATRFLDESDDLPCVLPDDRELRIKNFQEEEFHYTIKENQEGFYNIYFVSCEEAKLSFKLEIDLHNQGENGLPIYLSAGIAPLTTVYSLLFIVYVTVLIVWIFGSLRGSDKPVFLIHYLMTVLLLLKTLSILFKAVDLHYLKVNGRAGAWAAIYYVFSFLKGIMMFVVIALVGTGWTFIKPFLADKDKKIFLIVIPLQVLDNIALIIIEETAPGSQGWFTWKDIFRLVDIICCGAILVPIIWSIKHLKEASSIDGKAAKNLDKLKLFRTFYLIVVSYIYFTRIIVYLLDATLPFRWVWLGDLFTEIATFAFFCTVGYLFRPVPNNPWLERNEDDDDIEQSKTKESSQSS